MISPPHRLALLFVASLGGFTVRGGAAALASPGGAAPVLVQAEAARAEGAAPAAVPPASWDVEADHGPFHVFRRELAEGTWIDLDVAPDGATIVFDLLGHLYEMPVEGGEARALTHGRSWNMEPRYGPSGARIAFTSDRGGSDDLWVLDRETGELRNVSAMDLPVFQGTWSADGRSLYGTALDLRVRLPVYRFDLAGSRQEILPAGDRSPPNHFVEDVSRGRLYFEHNDARLYASGCRIKTYDLDTGAVEVYRERPGGAGDPALSPDGRRLAYVHRDDQATVLVIHDLDTREERVACRTLDRDRMESHSFYGIYPNLAWHPDGRHVFVSFGGGIHRVDADTGEVTDVPFRAVVERKIDDTIRFPVPVPRGETRTRLHRWGQRVPGGILYEALGDLWLLGPHGPPRPITRTDAHETDPVFDPASGRVFYATWTDEALGALAVRPLEAAAPDAGGEGEGPSEGGAAGETRLTSLPAPYGAIALSPGGEAIAYVRGAGEVRDGRKLEDQTRFTLCLRETGEAPDAGGSPDAGDAPRAGGSPGAAGTPGAAGAEREIAPIAWTANRYGHRPPSVRFSPDGRRIYYAEYEGDTLTLRRIDRDGHEKRTVATFPHATRAVLSPDLHWVAFREYHRSFVAPFVYTGKPLELSPADGKGFAKRVDPEDGDFLRWSRDGRMLSWMRGRFFCEKPLEKILAGEEGVERTDVSIAFPVAAPARKLALSGVRVLTMNDRDDVLEDRAILADGDRIAGIVDPGAIPPGYRVLDLAGRTVMPGMLDAHGHYGSPISVLQVIEQRLYGLHANLAYGVTTMVDVYGTTQKDFWVSDMLRAGRMQGPRLWSVGDPIFVTKYRTKMHRPIHSLDDALEHARFEKDHGARALKDYSNHTRAARQQLAAACRELGLNLVTESFADPMMNLTQVLDGYTGIEHTMGVTPLYDDVVSLLAASDVGLTPTLIVLYNGPAGERYFHQSERLWEDPKLLHFFRRDELLRLRRTTHVFADDWYHPVMDRELKKLFDAGVGLQMGAHGQMMGLGAHWEMELLVQGGFTPMEAIRIATIQGFRHHGLDRDLGSIEPGKLADLVVLREDPRTDIRHTRSIELVLGNGVVYDGTAGARVDPDPRPAKPMYFQRGMRAETRTGGT